MFLKTDLSFHWVCDGKNEDRGKARVNRTGASEMI